MIEASIIIPFRDKLEFLRSCLMSIDELTNSTNFELLLVDNSESKSDLSNIIPVRLQSRSIHIHLERPFNYSYLMNEAVEFANGSLLVHMNSDIEVLSNNWLEDLTELAVHPDHGCVGALLIYPNQLIQHAGVAMNKLGHTKHLLNGEPLNKADHRDCHEVPAVTGAVLAIRKELYLELGGMNEDLAIAYNDIDLCLKARQQGLKNICTRKCMFIHHESTTRGKDRSESQRSRYLSEQKIFYDTWYVDLHVISKYRGDTRSHKSLLKKISNFFVKK